MTSAPAKSKAIFLDRDGVLNHDSDHFIKSPEELIIFDGVKETLLRLQSEGFKLVIVTNQSGIHRGILTEEDLTEINQSLIDRLHPVSFTAIYHCPHAPDEGCPCRKPKPGMILQAVEEHALELDGSYMFGDRSTDISCGAAANVKTVLVLSGKISAYNPSILPDIPDYVYPDINVAVRSIFGE